MARKQKKKREPAVDPLVVWNRDVRAIGVWTVISVAIVGAIAWIVNMLG